MFLFLNKLETVGPCMIRWALMLIGIPFCVSPACARQEVQGLESDSETVLRYDHREIEYFEQHVKPILVNNCLECHGHDPDSLSGGLALISRRMILEGGDSGPAVDLDEPGESLLLSAINYDGYEMPPSGKLTDQQIEILTRWVEKKLPWTEAEAERVLEVASPMVPPAVDAEARAFWSFQNVVKPDLPSVKNKDWVSGDIDRFILSRLDAAGLRPAPAASRQTLIRRMYYDLTGLPPSAEQVESFLADKDENALANRIDELLESPRYGEKWGRHWLDLVRYAESNSFERDGTKPFVWRYRDYVIDAFNNDKPYDQFLLEQLAGDELEKPSAESIIATGYYRLGQWDDEPADPEQALFDELDDILATTSQTMLGLTVNCARCHDHKIDPIPTKDYYSMLAFFRNIRRYGVRDEASVLDASTRSLERTDAVDAAAIESYQRQIDDLTAAIEDIEKIVQADFQPVEHDEFKYEQNRVRLIEARVATGIVTRQQFEAYVGWRQQRQQFLDSPPTRFRVLCVKEHDRAPLPTQILIRGNPHSPGEDVDPAFISVLPPREPQFANPQHNKSSGRRLALARWIASKDHPLTARVMVNRIWQHHFGRGIVRTPSDFGYQGSPPTHPQLLDYLADQFVQSGWSVKQMHRLIMNSSAWKMSNEYNPAAYDIDPLNDLFWRFEMRRLTAEELRDSILAVSGRLNADEMHGPSVFPRLSAEVLSGQSMPGAGWGESSDPETRRRSVYIHVKRTLSVPLLASFDAADTDATCPVRFNTTQPTQALGLLNSAFTGSEAEEFAAIIAEQFDEPRDQIREILQRVTQRQPTAVEIEEGLRLIDQWQAEDQVDARQALAFFCLTAFNLNEFIFVE